MAPVLTWVWHSLLEGQETITAQKKNIGPSPKVLFAQKILKYSKYSKIFKDKESRVFLRDHKLHTLEKLK